MNGIDLLLFQGGAMSLGLVLGMVLDKKMPQPRYWYILPLLFLWMGAEPVVFKVLLAEGSWSWLQLAIGGQYLLAGTILLFTRRKWAPLPEDQ